MRHFIVREGEEGFSYAPTAIVQSEAIQVLNHPMRLQLLRLLAKREMYPAEIAQKLGINEQKVYYHVKQLANAGILTIHDRTEVRGTTAKRFKPTSLNFAVSIGGDWKQMDDPFRRWEGVPKFLCPFIVDGGLDAQIVVGSPDAHGPFKARARDSHYAIEVGLFLGQFCRSPHFSAMLDVDMRLSSDPGNLILVGGPVTNLMVSAINEHLPVRFSEGKGWELVSGNKTYTEEATGIVARLPNPLYPNRMVLVLAGLRSVGTKAAVIGLTNGRAIADFKGQEPFCHVVGGFDLDGDGKVDSIEIIE